MLVNPCFSNLRFILLSVPNLNEVLTPLVTWLFMGCLFIKEGRVSMSGLFSEKTGKTYDAVVVLDDTGEKYVNFKLEFPQQRGRKK